MEIDQRSKDLLSKAFEQRGWTVNSTSEFCNWDLVVSKNGVNVIVELKDRKYPSTQFNDNTIEEYKRHKLYQEVKTNPSIKAALIVSIYTDDVIFANNIHDEHSHATRSCPRTTAFTNNNQTDKDMVRYTPRQIWRILEDSIVM